MMPVTVKNDLKDKLNDNCIFHWIITTFIRFFVGTPLSSPYQNISET